MNKAKVKRGASTATPDAPALALKPEPEVQEWYEVETSRVGANDWFAVSNTTADTLEGARNQRCSYASGFEYRIVRRRMTTEVAE